MLLPVSWSCCRSNFLDSLFVSDSFISSRNFGEVDSLKPLTKSSKVWQTMKILGTHYQKRWLILLRTNFFKLIIKRDSFLVISRLKLTIGQSFAILGETSERRLIDNIFSFRLWYDVQKWRHTNWNMFFIPSPYSINNYKFCESYLMKLLVIYNILEITYTKD